MAKPMIYESNKARQFIALLHSINGECKSMTS
jgi:hypothetical protein